VDGANEAEVTKHIQDPLKWFGILVPPSLRSAQTDFNLSVTDLIPKLVGVERALKVQEERILRLRGDSEVTEQ
jgi:hypothetical protein